MKIASLNISNQKDDLNETVFLSPPIHNQKKLKTEAIQQILIKQLQNHTKKTKSLTEQQSNTLANHHIQPDIIGSSFLSKDIADFIDTLQICDGLKRELRSQHKLVQTQLNQPETRLKLTCLIFGEGRFKNKKLPNEKQIEGIEWSLAIYTYMKALNDYILKLKTPSSSKDTSSKEQIIQKFEDLFRQYPLFYISSLFTPFSLDQSLTPISKRLWNQQYVNILYQDMLKTLNSCSHKKRGAWTAGYDGHAIPFMYEKTYINQGKEPCLKLIFFNLGKKSCDLQINYFKEKIFNHFFVGQFVTDEGEIVCTESWVNEHLLNFCTKLNELKNSQDKLFEHFIDSYLPLHIKEAAYLCKKTNEQFEQTSSQPNPLKKTILQSEQVIGDCTCRGQWAMLRSEAEWDGMSAEPLRNFKLFLKKRSLKTIKKINGVNKKILNFNRKTNQIKTAQEIYLDCFSKSVRLSPKGVIRQQELERSLSKGNRWQTRCCRLFIPNTSKTGVPEIVTTLCLKDLFQGANKVVIGRYPASRLPVNPDPSAIYYGVLYPLKANPATGDCVILTRKKGKIYAASGDGASVTLYHRNGESKLLPKDHTLEVDETVERLEYDKKGSSSIYFLASVVYREYLEKSAYFNPSSNPINRDYLYTLKNAEKGHIMIIDRAQKQDTQYELHWMAKGDNRTVVYLIDLDAQPDQLSIWRKDHDLAERGFNLPLEENLIEKLEERLSEMAVERALRMALQSGMKRQKKQRLFVKKSKQMIDKKQLHVTLSLDNFYYSLKSTIDKKTTEYQFSVEGNTISVWKEIPDELHDFQIDARRQENNFILTDPHSRQFICDGASLLTSLAILFHKNQDQLALITSSDVHSNLLSTAPNHLI